MEMECGHAKLAKADTAIDTLAQKQRLSSRAESRMEDIDKTAEVDVEKANKTFSRENKSNAMNSPPGGEMAGVLPTFR